jgi:hypothetical protein
MHSYSVDKTDRFAIRRYEPTSEESKSAFFTIGDEHLFELASQGQWPAIIVRFKQLSSDSTSPSKPTLKLDPLLYRLFLAVVTSTTEIKSSDDSRMSASKSDKAGASKSAEQSLIFSKSTLVSKNRPNCSTDV